jgi:hypothetical protein
MWRQTAPPAENGKETERTPHRQGSRFWHLVEQFHRLLEREGDLRAGSKDELSLALNIAEQFIAELGAKEPVLEF